MSTDGREIRFKFKSLFAASILSILTWTSCKKDETLPDSNLIRTSRQSMQDKLNGGEDLQPYSGAKWIWR